MNQEKKNSTIAWLLDSDPSIRWQVMRDLTHEPADRVAAERAKVTTEGWGAALLAAQAETGIWGTDPRLPESLTLRTLLLLRDMGLDPTSSLAKRAIDRVRANMKWLMAISQDELPKDQDISWWHKPFFEGEVEPCINGRVVTIGAYFGEDMQPVVDRLLGEQMADFTDSPYEPSVIYIYVNTELRDYVLFWGNNLAIQWITQRPAPTRFAYQSAFAVSGFVSDAMVKELIDDLKAHPGLIIDTTINNDPVPALSQSSENVATVLRPLFEYIHENYVETDTLFKTDWVVYRYVGSNQ